LTLTKSVWSRWLEHVARRLRLAARFRRVRRRLARRAARARLGLLAFEDRVVPATVRWVAGAGGNWNTAANWQDQSSLVNRVPGAGDDVVIPDIAAAGPDQTITFNTGSVTVNTITSAEKLAVSGGTLAVTGALSSAGTVSMSGTTTLRGAQLTPTTTLAATAGTLDGVTVGGTLDMATATSSVNVQNGLTVNGTANLGNTAAGPTVGSFTFLGAAQSVGGTGQIVFGSNSSNAMVLGTGAGAVTFGPGLTVRGQQGFIGRTGETFINQGTIRADATTGTIGLKVQAGNFSTQATSILIADVGGHLNIAVGPWSNQGQIQVNDGAKLDLGGSFTQAGLGSLTRTGTNTVNLTGTVTGGLTLDDTLGTWNLVGATLAGGAVAVANGSSAKLVATNTTSHLTGGVTLNAPIDMASNPENSGAAQVDVTGGLTLNSTLQLGQPNPPQTGFGTFGILTFNGTQALTGTGTISLGVRSGNAINHGSNGQTLTIGPGVTIRGAAGIIGSSLSTVINQGTIRRDAGAGQFDIVLGPGGRNEGLIDTTVTSTASGSRTIVEGGNSNTWTNTGTISSAGALAIGFQATESWSNTGAISSTGGTVEFDGQFTQAGLGNFTRAAGSTVSLGNGGVLIGDLTLSDATGPWNLIGGSLKNGTFTIAQGSGPGVRLAPVTTGAILDGYTLASPITFTAGNQSVTVKNGLTLNTTQAFSPALDGDEFMFSGTQTLRSALAGGADILLASNSGTSNGLRGSNATTLTIDPSVRIHGSAGHLDAQGATIINRTAVTSEGGGKVSVALGANGRNEAAISAVNGGSLTVTGTSNSPWTNAGTISIAGGGTLQLGFANGETWTNTGSISVTGSTVLLDASFSQSGLGNFTRDGGSTVKLDSNAQLTGGLTLDDTTGSWQLAGGQILGGTVSTSGAAKLIVSGGNANSTTTNLLNNVTVNGTVDVATLGGVVVVQDALTLNGTLLLGNTAASPTNGTLRMSTTSAAGGQVLLTGPGTIVLGSSANNLFFGGANQTLVLDPAFTVRGQTVQFSSMGGVFNRGTMAADVNGGSWVVNPITFTNEGTVRASNGSILQLGGSVTTNFANYGTINVAGSRLNLAGQVTQAGVGNLKRDPAATIAITGTLNGDLTLDNSTGSWLLDGGKVQNGAINTAGTAALVATTNSSNTLDHVTLNGNLDVATRGGAVVLANGLTLNGTVQLGAADGSTRSSIRLSGNQTITGTGTIVFGTNTQNFLGGVSLSSPTITIDRGVTIRGSSGSIDTFALLDNRGTIASDVGGGLLKVFGTQFDNEGTVRADQGGVVLIKPSATNGFANLSGTTVGGLYSATLTGGHWYAGPSSSLQLVQPQTGSPGVQIVRLDADVTLDGGGSAVLGGDASAGVVPDALANLGSIGADGSLTVTNGRTVLGVGAFSSAGAVTVGPGARFAVTPTLVSRYGGEGNAGDATGRNPGTVVGAVGYAPGQLGQAFSFPGSSTAMVSVPDSPSLHAHPFTVSAWVNPTTLPTNAVIAAKTSSSGFTDGWGLNLSSSSGKVSFWVNISSNAAVSPTALPTTAWSYVLASYDGANLRLYVGTDPAHASLVATKAYTLPVNFSPSPMLIGGGFGTGFNGLIDEVTFYNQALDPTQAATLTPGPATFTQTAGTTALAGGGTLLAPGDTLTLQGGTLKGTGSVSSSVNNAGGTVAPGNSPGILDISGNFTQGPGGVLDLEIAGRDPDVPQFDRLRVTGTASIDGTVRETLLDGFEPTPGDNYQVLTSAGLTVAPSTVYQLPAPGGPGRRLAPIVDAHNLTIQAQRVPPIDFGYATTAADPGTGGSMNPTQVALDAAGDSYVVGSFMGTVDFDREHVAPSGSDTLTASILSNGFVAKYDPTGTLVWVAGLQNHGMLADVAGVAVDTRGNADPSDDRIYVTANTQNGGADYVLNGVTLTTVEGQIDFSTGTVLRLNPAGGVVGQWAISPGFAVTGATPAERVAVAPNGNVLVTGEFVGNPDFDMGGTDFSLSTAGGRDVYLAEYTPTFGFVRAARIGGTGDDRTADVAVDAAGNVWLSGTFTGTTTGLAALTSSGGTDAFVVRLQGSGTGFSATAAHGYGGPGNDAAAAVAVDPAGNAFLGGTFQFSVNFDPTTGRAFTLSGNGDTDAFTVKLDSTGGFVWARQAGGYRADTLADLTADASGNVYATGFFQDTVDFDPLDGSYTLSAGTGAALQAYVSKLDAAGRFQWAVPLGGQPDSDSIGTSIATDASGRVVSVGTFAGSVDFDPTGGSALRNYTPTPVGLNDTPRAGYLVEFTQKAVPQAAIAGLPAAAVAQGSDLALAAQVTDADSSYFTYAWTVTRQTGSTGVTAASGLGPVLGTRLTDPGTYTITLTVTDESGNFTTAAGTVTVTNAAPVLNPTAFGNPSQLPATSPPPVANGDGLGTVLATGNGFALAGAPGETVGTTAAAGAVRVYDAGGNLVRTLSNPTPVAGEHFGAAVAVVGIYAVVGAPDGGAGSVYLFDLGTGALVRTLGGPSPTAGDKFGAALGALGTFVLVGSPGRSNGVGAAYLFNPATGGLLRTYANPSPVAGDAFGTAVVSVGGYPLVGAPGDDSAGLDAGAAYLFDAGTARAVRTILFPNPAFPGSGFGSSLAAAGRRAVIGAPLDDSAGTDVGGVYLFDLDPASSTFGALVKSVRGATTFIADAGATESGTTVTVTTATPHGFAVGQKVVIDGVGVAGYNGTFTITAVPTATTFRYTATAGGFAASGGGTATALPGKLGSSVAFVGNRLLVGSEAESNTQPNAGGAFLIDADPLSATFGTTLQTFRKATPATGDRFGAAVAFLGDDAYVGAPGTGSGAAFRFAAATFANFTATTINENDTVTVSATFADPGPADAHTAIFDWGNGDPATTVRLAAGVNTVTASHRYLDDKPSGTASDTYSVRVRVLDDTPDLVVTDTNTAALRRYDGTTGVAEGTYLSPGGILFGAVVGPDGNVYLSDSTRILRYDGTTGAPLPATGQTGAVFVPSVSTGPIPGANILAFGPDGNVYVIDFPGSRVLRFDGRTGQPLPAAGQSGAVFISTAAAGVSPQAMDFGPDGNVYLSVKSSAGATGAVWRVDGQTGAFLAEFVPAGTGGLGVPGELSFGPDGDLYVFNPLAGTGSILRYDGTTGAFVGTVASPPPSGPHLFWGSDGNLYQSDSGRTFVTRTAGSTGEDLGQFVTAGAGGLTGGGYLLNLAPQDETLANLTVANVAPTVTVRTAPSPAAGQYTLAAVVTDPGTLDSISYDWRINGVPASTGPTVTFAAASPSGTSVVLNVHDDDTLTPPTTFSTLVVVGTAAADTITVSNGSVTVGGTTFTIPSGTNKVVVYGLAGNDTISAANVTSFPVELVGGAGSDTLTGGSLDDVLLGDSPGGYGTSPATAADDHGADSLTAGAGNDTLDGGLGNDTMAGGIGDDRYMEVPGSDDLLTEAGAGGIDTVDYSLAYGKVFNGSTYGISFSLDRTDAPQTVYVAGGTAIDPSTVSISGTFENLTGSGYSDVLAGNAQSNQVLGGSGNDVIFGGDPANLTEVRLGDGNDTLVGGMGNDTVAGGSGNDVIFGGDPASLAPTSVPDDNTLVGGSGSDTITGGSGNDVIFGGDPIRLIPADAPPAVADPNLPPPLPDNNTLVGGAGNDTVVGGSGNDVIFGGDAARLDPTPGAATPADDNTLVGGGGSDTVVGGSGNDVIFGGDDAGLVVGGTQIAPTAPGSPGSDSLVGGLGNDTVVGGSGNDVIFGGDPANPLPGVTGPPAADNDSLVGGAGSDTIVGGSGNDVIFGGDPAQLTPTTTTDSDSLVGGTGNDTVIGGSGNDVIFGGDPASLTSTSVPDDNTLVGGGGSDTITGGSGNDVIFGGDDTGLVVGGTTVPSSVPGTPDADSLVGGLGNDTIIGGSGNDVIFGGDPANLQPAGTADDNTLIGGTGSDTIVGGSGNDVIFGGDAAILAPASPPDPAPDNNTLRGALGNDTITGGSGNDAIFGGAGDDALTGGTGLDTFEGGSGTDRVIETAVGPNNTGTTATVTPTQLVTGGQAEPFYDMEEAALTGGPGNDRFDGSAFGGAVTLAGLGGNDTLIGGPQADSLAGGSGDDSLVAAAGTDVLDLGTGSDVADGGTENDSYFVPLSGNVTLFDAGGIDSIDLSSAAFAVTADLGPAAPAPQIADTSGDSVTLVGAFENLRGTNFNDKLKGSADRNILEGGGGVDLIDGGDGADTLQGSFPQVVYLDFDSATGKGEHAYTTDERNRIQARLEAAYSAPPFSVTFTQTAPAGGRFTTLVFNAGQPENPLVGGEADELDWRNTDATSRAGINVNGFLGRRNQPAATSDNYIALTADVSAHELGHLFGLRHSDAFGPIGTNPDTQLPYGEYTPLVSSTETVAGIVGQAQVVYPLKHAPVVVVAAGSAKTSANPTGTLFSGAAPVATFTIDAAGVHLTVTDTARIGTGLTGATFDPAVGTLTVAWAGSPADTSVQTTYQYSRERPVYFGPANATETPLHIMASPASVGTTIPDALGSTYHGERELIKLAFADASTTVPESTLAPASVPAPVAAGASAHTLALPDLAVPNLLPVGSANYGKTLAVRAAGVIGSINLAGATSENDVYAIQGKAGEYLNAEVLSFTLRQRIANPIDGVIRVFDAAGNPLDYYGQPAVNDDGLDNQDPVLQDVRLPADGTYYVMVDTFTGSGVPDTDTGGYELFVYTYANPTTPASGAPRAVGEGDSLVGGSGDDVLIGSAGDDRFDNTVGTDVIIGRSPDDVVGPVNPPPAAQPQTVAAVEDTPIQGALTATDPALANPAFTFALVPSSAIGGTAAVSPNGQFTFTPAADFNGSASFQFTATDTDGTGTPATVTIAVAPVNDAPSFTQGPDQTVAEDSGPQSVPQWATALSAGPADEAGQSLSFVMAADKPALFAVQPVIGADGTLTFTPAANANGTATVTVTLQDNGGTAGGGTDASPTRTFAITITPVNDPPTAAADPATTNEDTAVTVRVLANDTDVDGDAPSVQSVTAPAHGTATVNADGTVTYTPAADFNGADGFSYSISDGHGGTATGSVSIAVAPVNDAPTLAPVADVTAESGAGVWTVALTEITAGPTNEVGQQLTVSATTTNPALVTGLSVGPVANGTAELRFSPATAVGDADVTVTVTDDGGTDRGGVNSVSRTFHVKLRDTTAPVIAGAPTTQPNAAGWYNHDVTVHFAATDGGSGIAAVTADTSLSTEGAGQSVTGTATDHAGNSAGTTVGGINIDKTAPTTTAGLAGAAGTNGWYRSAATITLTAADQTGLSGVARTEYRVDGGAWQTYAGPFTLADGVHAVDYRSTDVAGNQEAIRTVTVKVDTVAPVIAAGRDTPANANGWNNTAVTASFTATDVGSGLSAGSGSFVFTQEGANQSHTFPVTDLAGNSASATVSGINIDKTAPTTAATANGTANPDGSYPGSATVTLSATDGLSGIRRSYYRLDGGADQAYDPVAGIVVNGTGAHALAYWSEDFAGNTEAVHTLPIQIAPASLTVHITGAPGTGPEGTAIALGTDVTGAGTATYHWVVTRNGSAYSLPAGTDDQATLTFTPNDDGTYVVTVTVTRGGSSVADQVTIAIANVAPAATVSGLTQGFEGVGVALTASGQDRSPVDQAAGFTYCWSATRNGSPVSLAGADTAAPRLVFAPTEPGTYTITLTVTDKDGGVGTASQTVAIVRAGMPTLQPDPSDPDQVRTVLVVGGTDGDDRIQVIPGNSGGELRVKLNGADSTFVGVGRVVIFAHDGADDVQIAGAVTIASYVDGGAGNDRLKGGNGSNVLVGGAGDDLLIGGEARDVLIGGLGADRLVGNAQDDILIAGTTDFDTSAVALEAVRAEWTRTGADFATRVGHLEGGAGSLSQGVLLTGQTVHNDGAADVLTGAAGVDWFIFNVDGTDPSTHDQVTDMTTYESEYGGDLDFMNEV
jgi:VCBS repeat-containing protein